MMSKCALSVGIWLACAVTTAAQDCIETQKLAAPDQELSLRFGSAVDVDGAQMIVGAYHQWVQGNSRAYVYTLQGELWTVEAVLHPPHPENSNGAFGFNVAIEGDVAAVRGELNGDGEPVVYIYRRDAGVWAYETYVSAPADSTDDAFGYQLEIVDGHIVVGLENDDFGSLTLAGTLRFFAYDGRDWALAQTIGGDTALARLGSSLETDGVQLIAGRVSLEPDQPIASVFQRLDGEWTAAGTLVPAVTELGGTAVAITGDIAVVSNRHADLGNGEAFIFERVAGVWTQAAHVSAVGDASYPTHFGQSIGAADGRVFVGAPGVGPHNVGAIQVFERVDGAWAFVRNLRRGTNEMDRLGIIIDASPTHVIAGSFEASADPGTAESWPIGAADCNGNEIPDACELGDGTANDCNRNGVPDACDIATGTSSDCNGNGIPDECDGGQPIDTLVAADAQSPDEAGVTVVMDDVWAYIGAPAFDIDGTDAAGSVLVMRRQNGRFVTHTRLMSPAPQVSGAFGSAIAVRGDALAVAEAGAVHIFRRAAGTWTNEATVEGDADALFGAALALGEDILVVGAPSDDDGPPASIVAYRHDAGEWNEVQTIGGDASLGMALAIDGDLLAIGIPDSGTLESGAVVIYRWAGDEYALETRIGSAHPYRPARFGAALALDGARLAIGAPRSNEVSMASGHVELWRRAGDGNWSLETSITTPIDEGFAGGSFGPFFGLSLTLDEDTLVVGTRTDSALSYKDIDGAWTLQSHLKPPWASPAYADFGRSVATRGGMTLVGAPHGMGRVYVFHEAGGDCNANGILDSCDVASGASRDMNMNGIPDECERLCAGDLDTDGIVGANDLVLLIAAWGACDGCPEDLDGDGVVDVNDIVAVFDAWGVCPP